MKRPLIILVLISLSSLCFSQDLNWAYSLQNTNVQDQATCIASNGSEFVIAGVVFKDVNLDFINGNSDYNGTKAFVAKYNEKAEIQWEIEQPGGGYNQRVFSTLVDDNGNVFAAGHFSGSLDFDPSSKTANYTASGVDAFVQKLDASGNLEWVAHAVTGAPITKMAQKSNGNIVAIGRTQIGITTTLSNAKTVELDQGVFVLEVSTDGKVIGAYSIGTPSSYNNIVALNVDANDNIIIGFMAAGEIDLDLNAGKYLDSSHSAYDAVIAKYNTSFQYQWHKVFGDVANGQPGGWDAVCDLQSDANGNIFATGYFTWTTDFDPDDNPGKYVLTAGTRSQTPDGFIIRYNPDGEIQWVRDAGTHPTIKGNTDVNFYHLNLIGNQILVAGTLNGGADFDGSADSFILQTADFGLGLCFATYSTEGNFKNAWLVDGIVSAIETISGIQPLGNGYVACGTFQKKCDMDPSEKTYLLNTDSTGKYYIADNDVFVAQYSLNGVVGIPDVYLKPQTFLPNPTNGVLNVNNPEQISSWQIYQFDGKLVGEGFTFPIDLTPLAPGTYTIKSTLVNNQKTLQKIIKY